MKVLLINNYHYRRGGSDTVYLNTGELLDKKGHKVIYFSRNYPENIKNKFSSFFVTPQEFVNSSFLTRLSTFYSFFYSYKAKKKLEKLLDEETPDLAHIHIIFGGLTSSILPVLKKRNIPVVITIHDYKLICPGYLFLNGKNEICEKCYGRKYYNCFLGKCVKGNYLYSLVFILESYFRDIFFAAHKYFNAFIFVSKFSMDKHLKFYPQLKEKSFQLYNFNSISNNQDFISNSNYFLFSGRLSREKGLKIYIEVAARFPNYKFVIIGDGPLKQFIMQNKTINVDYLGYKTGIELKNIIKNASFLIVPSEWYENNPMVIIESYSLGTPVIGSSIGGIPEIIVDEKTGFLFKMGDIDDLQMKINKALMLTKNEYALMAKKAKHFALEMFNEDTHYVELMKVYSKIIDAKGEIKTYK